MSHKIYTTDGFVISSENRSESDKLFYIFTKDLGLIRATAFGIRKIESKLRFSLQDFSFSEISFVLGKTGWRIVNANCLAGYNKIFKNKIKVKTLRLIKKICGEDEQNENLFNEICRAFQFIDNEKIEEDKSIEALIVLKILSNLGYWGEEKDAYFVLSPFNKEVLGNITEKRKEIIKELNKSLKATQLV